MTANDWISAFERFVRESYPLVGSAHDTPTVCRPILEFVVRQIGCPFVDVWSVDPRHRRLILIAWESAKELTCQPRDILEFDDSLTGETVENTQLRFFTQADLRSGRNGRSFQNSEVRDALNLTGMLSIPIRNTANPHQVLLVLNIHFDIESYQKYESLDLSVFKQSAILLATTIEAHLRERTFRESAELSLELSGPEPLTESSACRILAARIQKAIKVDQVSVFLEHPVGPNLIPKATVEVDGTSHDSEDDVHVPMLVREVWLANRERLTPFPNAHLAPLEIVDSAQPGLYSVALVPLHDITGQCKGVIRCVNWSDQRRARHHFTYDDVAVMEAIGQAFQPLLETFLAAKRRDASLQKLAHELRVPIVAFQAILERMERECERNGWKFRYRHFNETAIYSGLMSRLLKEVELARIGPSQIPLVLEIVDLETEIIIPATRFISPLLRDKQINPVQIAQRGFESLPKIQVDPGLITQIVFNLLENAIKYYDDEPALFACSITARTVGTRVEIVVSDNGVGISAEDASRIFEYGVRSRDALQMDVQGAGLGLWIARGVAIRHKGSLTLRHFQAPTEFVLTLPFKQHGSRNER